MVRNYWKAKSWLLVLALSFLILSPAGAQESSGDITEAKLTEISSALLAFEKEQNPVDLDAEKEKLVNRLSPRFETLEQPLPPKIWKKSEKLLRK